MNQIDISAMMQQVAKNANELAKLPILDEKQRNYLYNMAAQKCQAGDYINAVPLFQFLVLFDRTDVNSIKGLAGALHGAARYSDAINCYHMTYLQDSMNHVDSLFYMADCNIKLNKLDEAKKNIVDFLNYVNDDKTNRYTQMCVRCKLLLDGILKDISTSND